MNFLKSRLTQMAAGILAIGALAFTPSLVHATDEPDDICYGNAACDMGGELTWTTPSEQDAQGWSYKPDGATKAIVRFSGTIDPDAPEDEQPDLIHVHYFTSKAAAAPPRTVPVELSFERPAE